MVKKIFYLILALGILTIIPGIFASSGEGYNIDLKGNLSNSHAQVLMWNSDQIQVLGYNLPEKTDYTLVYLVPKGVPPEICDRRTPGCQIRPGPSSYSSTRYPKVKCMLSGIKTDKDGGVSKSGSFDYSQLSDDGKDEGLVLVKSSDVNCKTGTMKKWKTASYFFGAEGI